MKIIFLDFDGVLNNQLWYVRNNGHRGQDDLDSESIGFLNNLIAATDAKVVVTSTWRLGRSVEELQTILDRNGFKGEVIDKTKDMREGENSHSILRGNEILCWIKDNPTIIGCGYWEYDDYVIFDDDTDMLYCQKDNFIEINPYCGLTPNCVHRAKQIFMRNNFNDVKNKKL